MSCIKDEVLVAYADGALGAAERGVVESLLRLDPSSARAVLLFKLTRVYVQQAFAELDFTGERDARSAAQAGAWRRHAGFGSLMMKFFSFRPAASVVVCGAAVAICAVAALHAAAIDRVSHGDRTERDRGASKQTTCEFRGKLQAPRAGTDTT